MIRLLRVRIEFLGLVYLQTFDARFAHWRNYYEVVEVSELISPLEAMSSLMFRQKK